MEDWLVCNSLLMFSVVHACMSNGGRREGVVYSEPWCKASSVIQGCRPAFRVRGLFFILQLLRFKFIIVHLVERSKPCWAMAQSAAWYLEHFAVLNPQIWSKLGSHFALNSTAIFMLSHHFTAAGHGPTAHQTVSILLNRDATVEYWIRSVSSFVE